MRINKAFKLAAAVTAWLSPVKVQANQVLPPVFLEAGPTIGETLKYGGLVEGAQITLGTILPKDSCAGWFCFLVPNKIGVSFSSERLSGLRINGKIPTPAFPNSATVMMQGVARQIPVSITGPKDIPYASESEGRIKKLFLVSEFNVFSWLAIRTGGGLMDLNADTNYLSSSFPFTVSIPPKIAAAAGISPTMQKIYPGNVRHTHTHLQGTASTGGIRLDVIQAGAELFNTHTPENLSAGIEGDCTYAPALRSTGGKKSPYADCGMRATFGIRF
jgi:hypothetical protein